ncbi:glycerate kinase [Sporosarcina sp. E16_8]|uniref:glycerate kinase n=1 Tax=Sporosarcina sp. E16_8 TaxID=2789295 RepID=UPI001A929307|nr:glycerate kinase [Sporosarcina sp. E16_8]MBO0586959.1 glycerate kinase [Sporosarcina sp. E16_8]
MKVVVAPDSFKGSLTAVQAAQAMAAGIRDADPSIETVMLPAADGGEGTMDSLVGATGGKTVSVIVQDPLGRKIEASYGILGDEEVCVIEIAEASGLMLLQENERNPLITSTYGTGELIVHALDAGLRNFIIGLGGSATNDGGVGMLQAFGMSFADDEGMELARGGGSLGDLHTIDMLHFDKRISESNFLIACDVENPIVGIDGASAVFGPQKGASPAVVDILDRNLTKLANVVEQLTGISLHEKKGSGAAGGAGGAFQAFFPGEMKQGIQVVLDAISFDEYVMDADLVITGEGKTDSQTLSGKTPFGVAKVAQKKGKPVILISGALDEESRNLLVSMYSELHAIADGTVSSKESIEHASHYLRAKTKKVMEDYLTTK